MFGNYETQFILGNIYVFDMNMTDKTRMLDLFNVSKFEINTGLFYKSCIV